MRPNALAIGLIPSTRQALDFLGTTCDITEMLVLDDAIPLLRARSFHAIFVDSRATGLSPAGLDELRAVSPRTPKAIIGEAHEANDFTRLAEGHEFSVLLRDVPEFASLAHRLLFPRQAERLPLDGSGILVQGLAKGHPFCLPLLDLSNRGLSLALELGASVDDFLPGDHVTGVRLVDAEGALVLEMESAQIRHCGTDRSLGRAFIRVGLAFDERARFRNAPMRVVRERVPILATLRKACRSGSPMVVQPPDRDLSYAFAHAELVDGEEGELLRLGGPTPRELARHDVVRFSFDHHGQSYSGLTTVAHTSGGAVHLAPPRTLEVQHRRGSNRHRPQPERPFIVRLRTRLSSRELVRPALDINASGLSIAIDQRTDIVPPGLVVSQLELTLPDGQLLRCAGQVRGVSPQPVSPEAPGASPARCGIQLIDLSRDDQRLLADALLACGFPHVESSDETALDDICQLLEKAGLNHHFYADHRPETQLVMRGALSRLLGPARSVGMNLLYRMGGQALGHVASLRVYSRTWLATHLAALPGGFRQEARVSRALCLGYAELIETRPGAEFVKFVWNREVKWPNRMFGWTARAVQHRELTDLRELVRLVWPSDRPRPPATGVRVRDARPEELALIEQHFVESSSLLRVRSEDLTAPSLEMAELDRAYRDVGLRRCRRVRLALLDGQVAGFGLLEDSTPGLQLNEHPNSFEVDTLLQPGDARIPLVRQALVDDAVAFYRAKGMRFSVAVVDEHRAAAYLQDGFAADARLRSLTIHRSLFPSWIDVWNLLFSNRREWLQPGARDEDHRP